MKIAILDDYQNTLRSSRTLAKLSGPLSGHELRIFTDHTHDIDELARRLADVEALAVIRERTQIDAALIARLPKLRLVSNVSVYPHIDVAACTRQGIIVSSNMSTGGPSYATAELTWGLIIAALRRIPQELAAMKAGKWQAYPIGIGLRRKTLGIFGYGKLGSVIAGYGKAFGMNVLVWGRESTLAKAYADDFATANSQQELFERSDVLSLHLRLIDETRGIVAAADLARMKPDSLFVNTSRAGLVAPGALEAALAAGRPAMAAVDVFDQEPLTDPSHPLLKLDNVVCSPHLGYVERDGLEAIFSRLFEQILAYADGKPINVINPEVLLEALPEALPR